MSGNREYAGQEYGTPVTPTATMRFLVNRDGATKVCVIGDLPFVSSAQLSVAISASLSDYATTAALSAGLATKADSSALSNYALAASLGDAATKDVGATEGTVAAGNDTRFLTTAQQQMLAGRVNMTGTALSVSTYGSTRQYKDISSGPVVFTDSLSIGDEMLLELIGTGPATFPSGTWHTNGGTVAALNSSGSTFIIIAKTGTGLHFWRGGDA